MKKSLTAVLVSAAAAVFMLAVLVSTNHANADGAELSGVYGVIGTEFSLNYLAAPGSSAVDDLTLRITRGDQAETFTGTAVTVEGQSKVAFRVNVQPEKLTETMKMELLDNGSVVSTKGAYSAAEYCKAVAELYPSNTSLRTLLADLLEYGAAAQLYTGTNTADLANGTAYQWEGYAPGTYTEPAAGVYAYTAGADDAKFIYANLIWNNDTVAMQFKGQGEDSTDVAISLEKNGANAPYTLTRTGETGFTLKSDPMKMSELTTATYQATITKTSTAADTTDTPVQATITANAVTGSWANSRVGTSIGPERTYDGNATSTGNWNPAVTGFASDLGAITYTLDGKYDLTKVVLTFGTRKHYVTVSASSDGVTFTDIAAVNSANAANFYEGTVLTIDGITAKKVNYVKITFTGTENGTTWINMFETEIFGYGTTSSKATITANEVTGSWANSRVGTSIGPERTYDGNATSSGNWNPAVTGYASNHGAIIYTLDEAYNLSKIVLTFGTRKHYVTVSTSTDGTTFTDVAAVNSGNAANYYEGTVLTIDGITAKKVNYVKITFTGTENGTTWINMFETEIFGKPVVTTTGSVTYSVADYVKRITERTTSDSMRALAQRLWVYASAAAEYYH
ncbi:MAG: discoidin domain-containing protein [Lachnospiraceae bacterium]|nr:discoidin domain-containing protein [Lachnospiraceae bacterium]